jgi:antitoxin CptB
MGTDDMGRLAWRCRRGTRELDLILGRFLEAGYRRLDERQRELFERLLDNEDDRLQAWLVTATEAVDAEHAEIVAIIRNSG